MKLIEIAHFHSRSTNLPMKIVSHLTAIPGNLKLIELIMNLWLYDFAAFHFECWIKMCCGEANNFYFIH